MGHKVLAIPDTHLKPKMFDLTLECIRRHYAGVSSPLHEVLCSDSAFFDLFGDFRGYVDFFLVAGLGE